MSLARLVSRRHRLAGRLPSRLEDLRGPVRGVIVLPRHLSWPGLRECDVTDDSTRRSMYGILLTQGRRNDIARFLNARLLAQDWPLIKPSLDPKLRRWCERRYALRASSEPACPCTARPCTASPCPAGPCTVGSQALRG